MTRVLVTGGTGYVGARLAAYLAGEGAEVVVSTRQPVHALPYLPGAAVAQVDFSDKASLRAAMEGVDIVYHLAGANEIVAGQDPQRAVTDTITASLNALDAAVDAEVRRFVNFSTAHIYGPLVGRITEASPTKPTHPYAITNLAVEHFVQRCDAMGRIEAVNIRLSNAVGAPLHAHVDRWTLVATDLCRMAVERGELRLQSDGTQARDFVPLSDVVRIAAALGQRPRADLGEGAFNLGNGRTETVGTIAQMIQAAYQARTGQDIAIHYGPAPATVSNAAPLEFSIDRLRALDLVPETSLEAELAQTLDACFTFFGSD
ncbi:NAD-dependent epimerase/dehydratase family protein [Gymnodinialimonas sp.]